jgi:hypothetical protein
LRVTVVPQVEPTTELDTCDGCVPVTLARSARTLAIWSEVSDAVSTWTCVGLPGWLAICTTLATGPSALVTCAWVTGWAGCTLKAPPPLKSIPNLRPGTNRAISEISMATPEIRNHVRHRPTKSRLISPW